MLKALDISQMYGKTAEDSVKEATKRKQDQHILLKTQDTHLAVRKAHYNATCRRDYTKTIEEQASNKTYIFSTSFSMLWAESRHVKEKL